MFGYFKRVKELERENADLKTELKSTKESVHRKLQALDKAEIRLLPLKEFVREVVKPGDVVTYQTESNPKGVTKARVFEVEATGLVLRGVVTEKGKTANALCCFSRVLKVKRGFFTILDRTKKL